MYEQGKFHAQLSWAWKKFYNIDLACTSVKAKKCVSMVSGEKQAR